MDIEHTKSMNVFIG